MRSQSIGKRKRPEKNQKEAAHRKRDNRRNRIIEAGQAAVEKKPREALTKWYICSPFKQDAENVVIELGTISVDSVSLGSVNSYSTKRKAFNTLLSRNAHLFLYNLYNDEAISNDGFDDFGTDVNDAVVFKVWEILFDMYNGMYNTCFFEWKRKENSWIGVCLLGDNDNDNDNDNNSDNDDRHGYARKVRHGKPIRVVTKKVNSLMLMRTLSSYLDLSCKLALLEKKADAKLNNSNNTTGIEFKHFYTTDNAKTVKELFIESCSSMKFFKRRGASLKVTECISNTIDTSVLSSKKDSMSLFCIQLTFAALAAIKTCLEVGDCDCYPYICGVIIEKYIKPGLVYVTNRSYDKYSAIIEIQCKKFEALAGWPISVPSSTDAETADFASSATNTRFREDCQDRNPPLQIATDSVEKITTIAHILHDGVIAPIVSQNDVMFCPETLVVSNESDKDDSCSMGKAGHCYTVAFTDTSFYCSAMSMAHLQSAINDISTRDVNTTVRRSGGGGSSNTDASPYIMDWSVLKSFSIQWGFFLPIKATPTNRQFVFSKRSDYAVLCMVSQYFNIFSKLRNKRITVRDISSISGCSIVFSNIAIPTNDNPYIEIKKRDPLHRDAETLQLLLMWRTISSSFYCGDGAVHIEERLRTRSSLDPLIECTRLLNSVFSQIIALKSELDANEYIVYFYFFCKACLRAVLHSGYTAFYGKNGESGYKGKYVCTYIYMESLIKLSTLDMHLSLEAKAGVCPQREERVKENEKPFDFVFETSIADPNIKDTMKKSRFVISEIGDWESTFAKIVLWKRFREKVNSIINYKNLINNEQIVLYDRYLESDKVSRISCIDTRLAYAMYGMAKGGTIVVC